MDDGEGTSCQLCLRADDPADMVPVKLSHALLPTDAPTLLCRQCIAAILAASRAALESETVPDDETQGE